MSRIDFHQILGVKPDASAAEIKRAFKRMAMRWHPDRNPDPDAQEQFRRAREAFERLTEARDTAPDSPTSASTDSPPADDAAPPKGEDRHMELDVDLEEAALGGAAEVTVDGRAPCTSCDGSGHRSYGRTTMCGACHGSGRIRSPQGLETCPTCSGRGYFTDTRCSDCDGRGWHPAERQLSVTLPPAMLPGEELRIAGQGGPAPEGGVPGDLYLAVKARPHPLFRLEGHDLHLSMPVSVFRVLAGGEIRVPTLGDPIDVLLPESSTETRIVVPGAGFPGRQKRRAGDLVVHLQVQYPRFLTNEQKALLEMADQVMHQQLDDQSPILARWRDQHRAGA